MLKLRGLTSESEIIHAHLQLWTKIGRCVEIWLATTEKLFNYMGHGGIGVNFGGTGGICLQWGIFFGKGSGYLGAMPPQTLST